MAGMDVTVSIVNHESRGAVLESLAALEADQTRRSSVEIVVVDNASADGSVDAIPARFPGVEVVARRQRAGYGANHNLALGRARGTYVLFLNDDAIVRPGAIDAMRDHLDRNPHVGVAAPTLVHPDGRAQPSVWPRPRPALDVIGALRLGRPPGRRRRGSGPRAVGWAMGCALLVRRSAALAVGGFDEGYFMYSEEVDLCSRLADLGHTTHLVPEAIVIHEGQASSGAESPDRAVEMARSRRRYWRRHYGAAGRMAAQVAVSAQFAGAAAAARLRRSSMALPFWLQAVGCWRDPGHPGLRERADEYNRKVSAHPS